MKSTFNEVWLQIIDLDDAQDCCFPNVGVQVLQRLLDGGHEVLEGACETQGAETSQREAPYFAILVVTVFEEGVDGHNCGFRVGFSVVGKVKVDHLLFDDIVGVRGKAHFVEEAGNVNTCEVWIDIYIFNELFIVAYYRESCTR